MAYNNFPYTDLNSLNLDWIIKKCKEAFSREIPTKTSQLENDSGFGTYTKPDGGIPKSDLSAAVQESLNKADTAYQEPAGGIPETDLSAFLQALLSSLAANEFKPYPVSNAAGSPATFSDGADDIPVKDLAVTIVAVQSGTGDPAPDNVRPISGWTGASISISPTADPADGTTIAIAFPAAAGTVYGGTLDVTTGKLTVNREFHTYDENASFSIQRVDNNRALVLLRGNITSLTNYTDDYICDRFSTNTARTSNDTIGSYFYSGTFRIRTPESWGTTESEIMTALSNNPVTFVYPRAEPVVYDLTPTEVKTLLGTNNIWADCGSSTVEYRADITLYIDNQINP